MTHKIFQSRNDPESPTREIGSKTGLIHAFFMLTTNEQKNTSNVAKFNVRKITNFGKWAIKVNYQNSDSSYIYWSKKSKKISEFNLNIQTQNQILSYYLFN